MEEILLNLVCKKLRKGKSPIVIAEELEEESDRIQKICDIAMPYVPNYDLEKVFEAWKSATEKSDYPFSSQSQYHTTQ